MISYCCENNLGKYSKFSKTLNKKEYFLRIYAEKLEEAEAVYSSVMYNFKEITIIIIMMMIM